MFLIKNEIIYEKYAHYLYYLLHYIYGPYDHIYQNIARTTTIAMLSICSQFNEDDPNHSDHHQEPQEDE